MAGTRLQRGVLKVAPFSGPHSKATFGVIWASLCAPWPNRSFKRVPNGGPQEVKNELKTRVPTKTNKTSFGTLFATFQPCPLYLKTLILGTVLGHLNGVPSEVNKRRPPNTHLKAHMVILGAQKMILGLPEGSHLEAKSFKMESWKTCPVPWSAKVAPRWPPEDPRSQN